MADDWVIRRARASELPRLAAIEEEADVRFEAIPELAGVPEVLTPPGALDHALALGLVWVAAARADDVAVGFAYGDLLDGALQLEELGVLPAWGRRGIGRALVETAIAEARARCLSAVTLTTFRDVAWNAPFYARIGFRVLASSEHSPGLAALVAAEERRGLPARMRVVMRYDVASA